MKVIFILLFLTPSIFASDQFVLAQKSFDQSTKQSKPAVEVTRVTSKKFVWTKTTRKRYLASRARQHIKRMKALSFAGLGAAGISALGALEYSFASQYPIVFKLIGWGLGGFFLGLAGLGVLLMAANGVYPKSEIKLSAGLGVVGLSSALFAQAASKVLLGTMIFGGALLSLALLTLAIDQTRKAYRSSRRS